MSDRPLDMLVVRDMPGGTFAVADVLQGVRIVQDGFKSRAEAEKWLLGPRHHRAARSQKALISFGRVATLRTARRANVTGETAFRHTGCGLRLRS